MQVINLIGMSEDDFLACAEEGLRRRIESHQRYMFAAESFCNTPENKKLFQEGKLNEARLTNALYQVQMRRYELKYGRPDSMKVKEATHNGT